LLNEERGKNRILTFVILLVILQGVLRTSIFIASYQVDFLEEGQASDDNLSLMNTMFLILGIAGLAFGYPLIKKHFIGLYGTIAVSVATIAFDVWGMVAVQYSAAMGIEIPILTIALLFFVREELLKGDRR